MIFQGPGQVLLSKSIFCDFSEGLSGPPVSLSVSAHVASKKLFWDCLTQPLHYLTEQQKIKKH